MLSHGNLASNALTLDEYWGFKAERDAGRHDVLLHTLPLFHVHGLFVASHAALLAGAKTILLPKFDLAAALKHSAAVDRVHGRAHPLHAAAVGSEVRARALRVDAPLHLRLGTAPRGDAQAVRGPDRAT